MLFTTGKVFSNDLHLCSANNIVVTEYIDHAMGIMTETKDGSGKFKEVTLHPVVTISEKTMVEKANELHKKANEYCFIANSVSFSVHHRPTIKLK